MRFRTKGIILKRRNFGEADKILTLLTPGRGKIEVIARGVRKIKARLGGHLEIFYEVDFDLEEGKTWYVVTGAETVQRFIRANLDQINLASYGTKLLMKLAQNEEENPKLYNLFRNFLAEVTDARELLIQQFTWQLLLAGGFRPKMTSCTLCGGQVTQDNIGISPQAGGIICTNCEQQKNTRSIRISENSYKALRLFESAPLAIARKIDSNSVNQDEIKKINKIFWEYYLDYSLE